MDSSNSYVNYVPALFHVLNEFSGGVGLSIEDITRYLKTEYPQITDNEINIMIEEGIKAGKLIELLGENGPIAIPEIVIPILQLSPNQFTNLTNYVDVITKTLHSENECHVLITKIETMIKLGYLKATIEFGIKVKLNPKVLKYVRLESPIPNLDDFYQQYNNVLY